MLTTSIRVRLGIAATATVLGIGLLAPPASAAPGDGTATTYANPVSSAFADTYADPAVIRGKDGYWYAYGTTDPLREGETARHLLPMSRSSDLVNWELVGDAFTEATMPAWADRTRNAALWAPDIRYVDGQYRLYYVVTETTVTGEPNDNAIGMAYSDSPTGPWTDAGAPVVGPRRGGGGEPGNFLWTFDPHHVVGPGGAEYLFYGSYYGGIWVSQLSPDGARAVGQATQVAIDNKYEGAYVVQHDGWWYLMASSANCCAGPTTGYSVHVGRSRSLLGPYVDREGVPLRQSRAGGTPVLAQNGNNWIGTGHNAVVTDLAGQDWAVYHAIDRRDPYLNGTEGINERPMLIDRLDWIDGWPTVRAGRWASEGLQPGPTTGGATVTDFTGGVGSTFTARGGWMTASDAQTGTSLRSTGSGGTVLTQTSLSQQVRVEADLRRTSGAGEYGLQAAVNSSQGTAVSAVVDPGSGRLVVRSTDDGQVTAQQVVALPPGYAHDEWHSLVLEIRGAVATAQLTNARLFDPLAVVSLTLPSSARQSGQAGALAIGAGAWVDNLSALRAAALVTAAVPTPRPGTLLAGPSDEFNAGIEADWTRVRSPQVTVSGRQLAWPVEATDLTGPGGNAGLLLRNAPATNNWTVETKLTIDLGTDTVRNYQQGGLIAYVDDDNFARLSHVAIWNTRQTEFGREMRYAGRTTFGGTIIGPPAETTWLRLTHRTDGSGEHELQASTSRDGRTWVHGGVWTFPAGSTLRIGLVSHGAGLSGPRATAQFDYFRVYQD